MVCAKTAGLSAIAVSLFTVAFIVCQLHEFLGSVTMVKQKLAVHMDEFKVMQVSFTPYDPFVLMEYWY